MNTSNRESTQHVHACTTSINKNPENTNDYSTWSLLIKYTRKFIYLLGRVKSDNEQIVGTESCGRKRTVL